MEPVTFEGANATLTISRPAPRVVLLTISGRDAGEHGDGPMRELARDFEGAQVTLFIDARATQGAIMEVSNQWATWLRARREQLVAVHMLTGSRFVQLTADFVKRWADLGDKMRIYTDAASFDEALRAATSA